MRDANIFGDCFVDSDPASNRRTRGRYGKRCSPRYTRSARPWDFVAGATRKDISVASPEVDDFGSTVSRRAASSRQRF